MIKKHIIKIDKRLEAVVNRIGTCTTLADIGSDHAYLPIFLLQSQNIESCIVTDINEGPLENSSQNTEKYRVDEQCEFRIGSGLDPIKKNEVDVISICGMGGDTIAEILENGESVAKSADRLVLQPMTNQILLRRFLLDNGYHIISEDMTQDRNHFYQVITASFQADGDLNDQYQEDFDLEFPMNLILRHDPVMKNYLTYKLKVEKKISDQLRNQTDKNILERNKRRIEMISERLFLYESE